MSKITKNITIGELISKHPEAAIVLMEAGMGCVGCPAAASETIEQGCLAHGLDEKQINELLKKINQLLDKKTSSDK